MQEMESGDSSALTQCRIRHVRRASFLSSRRETQFERPDVFCSGLQSANRVLAVRLWVRIFHNAALLAHVQPLLA